MDSGTVAADGFDGSESAARVKNYLPMAPSTPTAYVAPAVRIRASPSFDDDEIEFESESDDVEDEVRGLDGNVNGLKQFGGSSSFRVLSSVGSSGSNSEEEEEDEGGFLSGEEEFVAALERPYGTDKYEEDGDGDVAFVEPFESLRPIAKLSEDDEDDHAELSVSESDEEVSLDAFEGMYGVKFMVGGDSVVDSINVDVNVAEPGVVVLEDVKPDVVESSEFAKPVEDFIGTMNVEEREFDEDFDDKKVEMLEMVKLDEDMNENMSVLVVTPYNDDMTLVDGVKLTSDDDAVVQVIQVDPQEVGVTDVNGSEEITNLPEIHDKDDMLAPSLSSREILNTDHLPHFEMLMASGEDVIEVEETKGSDVKGDVVEAIHLDVSEPGVVVVEDSKEVKKPEVKLAESVVDEALELNNGHNQTSADVNVKDGVFHSDDDEILEEGIDRIGKHDEIIEVDKSDGTCTESSDNEIKSDLQEPYKNEGSASDDDMILRSTVAAKNFLEKIEQRSASNSRSGAESSRHHSQVTDGQIVTDSDEELDSDEEGNGKPLFDSAALASLLKAAAGSGAYRSISPQDISSLFSVKRPADLVSSLRARSAPRRLQPNLLPSSWVTSMEESEGNLSDEEKKKLDIILQLRVKYLRLVYRLGQSPEDSIVAQVLHHLSVLVPGRPSGQVFNLDAAKRNAWELEIQGDDIENLNFSLNILVIGKTGVGKSATINSIFGVNKTVTNAFEPATTSVKEITGLVNGVHIRVFDTPGLKTCAMEQVANAKILASVKKATKKCQPDIVVYVDRLDAQTRDLNDLPLLKTITSSLGPSIWQSTIVLLTHASSALPDGPSGTPLRYVEYVAERSRAVQRSIIQAVGDLRVLNPNMMYPVSLAENHPSHSENGEKVLPNGRTWLPQFLMFCYSMKILSEASASYKQPNQFGFQIREHRLSHLLSWLMHSRTHPKLSADQGGDDGDSDIDLNDLSESEAEEDEYDQLPPFKPLQKSQLAKLNKEQLKAYHEEYEYRVKLLQKKQLKEHLKRMKEMKKGNVPDSELLGRDEADPGDGAPAPVSVPFPDMVLPHSFDCDNPTYRYRFLEPASQLIARPVLRNHGWDHDCGYDGVNLEQSLAIANRFPADIIVQITKDKKEFNVHLDSSVAAKHGDNNASTMAGFDIQRIEKNLAYTLRGETRFKNLKNNKTTAGFSVTFLGDNIATGVKIEDQLAISKRLVLTGSTATIRCRGDSAHGANLEIKFRDSDFPIVQDQSSLSLSLVKWRRELTLGAILQSQFSVGQGSKMAFRFGINNESTGQLSIRTSTSDPLQITLVGILAAFLGVYRAVVSGEDDY